MRSSGGYWGGNGWVGVVREGGRGGGGGTGGVSRGGEGKGVVDKLSG